MTEDRTSDPPPSTIVSERRGEGGGPTTPRPTPDVAQKVPSRKPTGELPTPPHAMFEAELDPADRNFARAARASGYSYGQVTELFKRRWGMEEDADGDIQTGL